MRFTKSLLISTSRAFESALDRENLSLPKHTALDVWSGLLFDRRYSAACPQLEHTAYEGVPECSATTLQELLHVRRRTVSMQTANDLIAAGMYPYISELPGIFCEALYKVKVDPKSCLHPGLQAKSGIAIFNSEEGGYLPIEKLSASPVSEENMQWLRQNSAPLCNLANQLCKKTSDTSSHIVLSSIRANERTKNRHLSQILSMQSDEVSARIAISIFENFTITDFDFVEFREIRPLVQEALEKELWAFDRSNQLAECDLAKAVVNHIAAEIIDELSFFCDNPEYLEGDDPHQIVRHTTKLGIMQILEPTA